MNKVGEKTLYITMEYRKDDTIKSVRVSIPEITLRQAVDAPYIISQHAIGMFKDLETFILD
jgi:hypothetical protein